MITGKIENPEVTVVMSVYNGEEFLKEAIESVLNQSFANFEFLIFNDFSTDQTAEILQGFESKDNRILVFDKPINRGFQGFVENLNLGISKARGKFIARMDADDVCHPNRLEKQVQFLKENPAVFLVGTSMNLIDEKGIEIGKMDALTDFEQIKKRTRIDNPIFHPTILFRNEVNLFYRDKMYACEDYDFHLRSISEEKILRNLAEPLLNYRVLQSSISRKGNSFVKRLFLEKAKVFSKQRKNLKVDDYENFNSTEFLELLNPEFENKQDDLLFAANVAILYNRTEELKIISNKLKKFYKYSSIYFGLNQVKLFNKMVSFAKRKIG